MPFHIDPALLTPLVPQQRRDWSLWQKKNFNIHRGLIEFTAPAVPSIDDIARDVRAGVRDEFRPSWWRGLGFGAIIHFDAVPADFTNICRHVDLRNKRDGVWQWAIVCLDDDKVAVGIHTWLQGYLRPVYESVMLQLSEQGYTCYMSDAKPDALVSTLLKIHKTCRLIRGVSGLIS